MQAEINMLGFTVSDKNNNNLNGHHKLKIVKKTNQSNKSDKPIS
jgi:hypothetical protein